MQKYWNKAFLKDVLLICFGILVLGFGSALVYHANIGTGSIGTFVDGLHQVFGLSHGEANTLVCVVFFLPAYLFVRDKLGVGTLISVFAIGLAIDFWQELFARIPVDTRWQTAAVYGAGVVINSIGASIYIAVDRGISSFDAMPMILFKLTKLQYRYCKIIVDCTMVLSGTLMGGMLGIGTVVSAIAGGYLMQFFINLVSRVLRRPSPVRRGGDTQQAQAN